MLIVVWHSNFTSYGCRRVGQVARITGDLSTKSKTHGPLREFSSGAPQQVTRAPKDSDKRIFANDLSDDSGATAVITKYSNGTALYVPNIRITNSMHTRSH